MDLQSMTSPSYLVDGAPEESVLDPRALTIDVEAVRVEFPDKELHTVLAIALKVYNDLVLVPTQTTWRKEDGARRELEREVERCAMRQIAEQIRAGVCAAFGGSWHVVYGRDFGTYVTHKRQSFCHFKMDGADVVVWRHGG